MKKLKLLTFIMVLSSAVSLFGCSGRDESQSGATSEVSLESLESDSENNAQDGETQPDPLAEKNNSQQDGNSGSNNKQESKPAENSSSKSDVSSDMESEANSDSDDDVSIEEAQELFELACRTNWDFHVGSPYDLDFSATAQNDMGWDFYLVKDEGINSLADVEADYYTIFSSKYPNDLNEIFIENQGHVYALGGDRGADIYYIDSVVTSVKERTEDEIIFNVENNYSGDDYTGTGPYTETEEFSVVISDDGSLRVGRFRLPY